MRPAGARRIIRSFEIRHSSFATLWNLERESKPCVVLNQHR